MSESEHPFRVPAEEDPAAAEGQANASLTTVMDFSGHDFSDLVGGFSCQEHFSVEELFADYADTFSSPDAEAIAGGAAGDVRFSWGRIPDLLPYYENSWTPDHYTPGSGRSLKGNGAESLTAPPGFLNSPAVFFSPPTMQSPFGMPHQNYPSCSSANGDQATTSHQLIPMDAPSQDSNILLAISGSRKAKRSSLSMPVVNDDGYKWRKYGDKPIKGTKGSRSHNKHKPNKENIYSRGYYRCTHLNCPVRKQVQRSMDGCVTQIAYMGKHNHEGRDEGSVQAASSQLNKPIDSEDSVDAYMRFEEDYGEEACAEGSSNGAATSEGAASGETGTGPKVVVQTTSEVLLLDDGYRWRKYGQKVVKGNHNPRSYYKCTTTGCDVRKHVERSPTEPKDVITTYEGKHNHSVPAGRYSRR